MRKGTPDRGPAGKPAATALPACSYCLCTMALMLPLIASARAIATSSTVLALSSPLAMSPARAVASCLRYSSKRMASPPPSAIKHATVAVQSQLKLAAAPRLNTPSGRFWHAFFARIRGGEPRIACLRRTPAAAARCQDQQALAHVHHLRALALELAPTLDRHGT